MRATYDLAEFQQLIKDRDLATVDERLSDLSTRTVSDLFDELPTQEATVVFRLLSKERASDVFDELDAATQAALIESLGYEEVESVFRDLDPEEQAWLLDEVPARVAKRIQRQLPDEQLARANTLLGYPVDSIARRMSAEQVIAHPQETVQVVVERVRHSDADSDKLTLVPVIDRDRILLGTISLLDLSRGMLLDPETTVGELCDRDAPYARTYENNEEVARRVLDSGDLLLPIVDAENRLVGIFPISDAARIDRGAVAEDIARQGASEPLQRPYLLASVFDVAKSRIVWLMVLAISAVLTVQVLEIFEATLAEVVALALFIPLLTGIGGNTGSQAATTVTRAIGLGNVGVRDLGKVMFKELRTGAVLGVLLSIIAFSIASIFYGVDIGTVIGLTLLLVCPMAATVGGVIPLVAKACKVDPAVFSTPFISTFCDATGLLIYFSIARAVLGL